MEKNSMATQAIIYLLAWQ